MMMTPDPVVESGIGEPLATGDLAASRNVTVLRFTHQGTITRPATLERPLAQEVRFAYRLDLSSMFPRLHDAVRGIASVDSRTGRIAIIDVPRNYELPVRARLRGGAERERTDCLLILNKNGLVRVEEIEA
jgi:hypothetical protein